MNTSNARNKQIAIEYLQATRTSRGYRYSAHETSSDWIVSARDLAKLGRMLSAGETDAYSQWASTTDALEVSR